MCLGRFAGGGFVNSRLSTLVEFEGTNPAPLHPAYILEAVIA